MSTFEGTSIHDAGHAVVSLLLKGAVVHLDPASTYGEMPLGVMPPESYEVAQKLGFLDAVVSFAGPVAEWVWLSRSWDKDGADIMFDTAFESNNARDKRDIDAVLKATKQEHRRDEARMEAFRLVKEEWEMITALAEYLRETGEADDESTLAMFAV